MNANFPLLIFLLSVAATCPSAIAANDQAQTGTVVAKGDQENDFEFSKRNNEAQKESQSFDLKNTLGDAGIKVLIGIGVGLIVLLVLTRKKTENRIPIEAVEILGTIPLSGRQNIQLIRFGQKLVLIEMSANGLKPISEITDPMEVNQMLDLIRPRTR